MANLINTGCVLRLLPLPADDPTSPPRETRSSRRGDASSGTLKRSTRVRRAGSHRCGAPSLPSNGIQVCVTLSNHSAHEPATHIGHLYEVPVAQQSLLHYEWTFSIKDPCIIRVVEIFLK
jgi:hypothetical protein